MHVCVSKALWNNRYVHLTWLMLLTSWSTHTHTHTHIHTHRERHTQRKIDYSRLCIMFFICTFPYLYKNPRSLFVFDAK